MTDQNYTALLIVLDRSGSMSGIAGEMETAVQTLVEHHASLPGFVTVDLVTFDNQIEHTYALADPKDVKVVLEPRGGTALYDAIGWSFNGFGQALAALPEHARPGTVLVTIVTDGYENSSQEYRAHTVKKIITRQREKYDWDISFLGANQDAIFAAGQIGIEAKDAIDFGIDAVAASMSVNLAKQSRRRGGDRRGYTDHERAVAKPE